MSRALRAALLGYAALLRLYPPPFRRAFGAEMLEVFAAALSDAAGRSTGALLWLCARELHELPGNLLREYHALWFARPPRLHPTFPSGGGLFMDESVPARSLLNLRPVYAGLVGGMAAAAALFLALCGALPLLGVPGWSVAPLALAGLGRLLVLLLPLVAGYCAACWGWFRDARGALCAGALAGALTGLVAWLLVGSAGAGVLGQAELLRYGARQAPTGTMLGLLSESVAGIVWATHLSFWVLAGLGAALGGLGGWQAARMVSGGLLLITDTRLFFGLTALVCVALSLTLRPTAAQQLTSIASRLRSGADYLLLAWPVCAVLVKLGVTAATSSLVSGPIALMGVLTNGNDPLNPTVPGIVQTLIGAQLAATLVLVLIPLLLLFCSSVYGALYRRWSAPHGLGWGLG